MSKTFSRYMNPENLKKLKTLRNPHVEKQVERFLNICKPAKATVITDVDKDINYVRNLSISLGEEIPLKMKGHTVHYDSFWDQARDKENTRVLKTPRMKMSSSINTKDRAEGLKEVLGILDGAMKGKECLIRFFSLGPTKSRFTQCALQLTDSAYVAHSEDILYRKGYEEFKRLKDRKNFFTFIHSAGETDKRNTTKNIEKRRIYIDVLDGKVYSVNNQYAGNSLGLKKLALRLAIYKANHEAWLAEHMLIMGIRPSGKNRITYFTGAFPSACGKTSTAMIPGQRIVGDDIAYLKEDAKGNCRAVNIESGVFGIIRDVNPEDDPLIFETITTPREMIFSNVLVHEGEPYWLGMGLPEKETPEKGMNHSGEWYKGKRNGKDNEIPLAHPNARFTIGLNELENIDLNWDDRQGHIIRGIFYGGRDTDTNVPISEALSWEHGVYIGATIESETTSATLGKAGLRQSNPMAIMDFMVIPFGLYLTNHINFGSRLKNIPKIFSTNYFLQNEEGKYLNRKVDKKIWVFWSEGRVHEEYDAIKTPVGYIPRYLDLKDLFREVFDREFTHKEYLEQFSIRVGKYLEKQERMEKLYGNEEEIPEEFWKVHYDIKRELEKTYNETGKNIISPSYFQ